MGKRVERTRCGGTWTEARWWNFIRGVQRMGFKKYPAKYQCLAAASRPSLGTDKRTKTEYQCAVCKGWFKKKDIEVDHIVPAGSLTADEHIKGFIMRMFCEVSDLRCLCCLCHKTVTAEARSKK